MSDSQSGNALPIEESQLAPYLEHATTLLNRAADLPPRDYKQSLPGGVSPLLRMDSLAPQRREISVLDLAGKVSRDKRVFTDGVHACITAVRRGIQIGEHLSSTYMVMSNLDQLIEENKRRNGQIPPDQRSELEAKQQTASAIALFAAAYYTWKELSRYQPDKVRTLLEDLPWKPAFNYMTYMVALNSYVFNLGLYLERAAESETDLPFVATTLQYMRAVIDEVSQRKDAFRFADAFTGVTYRLKGTEFSIHGFEADLGNGGPRVEFKKVKYDEIVGNRAAKHSVMRQVQRLACFDPVRKMNPFVELKGMYNNVLGSGFAGTGKTLLASAMCTHAEELCDKIGLPFRINPLTGTVVSTFQGGSAERADAWFDVFESNPGITIGLIDDAENVLEDRTRQGVSAGVREVIASYLRRTEGATAIFRGNWTIAVLTNIPDQIDPAVLSRANERFDIDGFRTEHDALDQDKIWYGLYQKMDPNFVNLADPKDYQYFADQGADAIFKKMYEDYDYPKDERIRAVVQDVEKKLGRDARKQQRFYALVYTGVQEKCPEYHLTSRDMRNVQTAVSGRIMDFDLPQLWFDKPEEFFRKDYDTKKLMLIELMKQSMKGLSFAEIRYQEMIRYLDTLAGIRNTGFNREVERRVQEARIIAAANAQLNKG